MSNFGLVPTKGSPRAFYRRLFRPRDDPFPWRGRHCENYRAATQTRRAAHREQRLKSNPKRIFYHYFVLPYNTSTSTFWECLSCSRCRRSASRLPHGLDGPYTILSCRSPPRSGSQSLDRSRRKVRRNFCPREASRRLWPSSKISFSVRRAVEGGGVRVALDSAWVSSGWRGGGLLLGTVKKGGGEETGSVRALVPSGECNKTMAFSRYLFSETHYPCGWWGRSTVRDTFVGHDVCSIDYERLREKAVPATRRPSRPPQRLREVLVVYLRL